MKFLKSNAKHKSIGSSAKMLRAVAALTLIMASGVSAHAQDLGFEQSQSYRESAEPHQFLSFKFNERGVDEKSVSFLESQKEIDFKSSNYSGNNRTSISQEDRNFIFKKTHTSKTSTLKESLELTAGLSKGHVRPSGASSVLNPNLERFKPRDLVALAQGVKPSPATTETPLLSSENSTQHADVGTIAAHTGMIETALLP